MITRKQFEKIGLNFISDGKLVWWFERRCNFVLASDGKKVISKLEAFYEPAKDSLVIKGHCFDRGKGKSTTLFNGRVRRIDDVKTAMKLIGFKK